MKSALRRGSSLVTLVLIMFLAAGVPAVFSIKIEFSDLEMRLYTDGVVDVRCEVGVDSRLARVNVSLPSSSPENLIIKDDDGFLLDYTVDGKVAYIDSLGAEFLEIFYSTASLTNKTGSYWVFSFQAPVESTLTLPAEATIISLSPTPTSISISENSAMLTMPPGSITVSYVLGVLGTKENAFYVINEARSALDEGREEGLNVDEADALLTQAEDAYTEGLYSKAEQYASQIEDSIKTVRASTQEALVILTSAEADIESASDSGRTTMLEQAIEELAEAKRSFERGDYEAVKQLAYQASIAARMSRRPPWYQTPLIWVAVVPALVTPVAIIIYLRRRGSISAVNMAPVVEPVAEEVIGEIDLTSLFKKHNTLRLDEKEVIRYIYECGGGVFASELRERFGIPKSSAWRMIRRLESEEILETKMVGRETYVYIGSKYMKPPIDMVDPSFQIVPEGSSYQSLGS